MDAHAAAADLAQTVHGASIALPMALADAFALTLAIAAGAALLSALARWRAR